MSLHEYRSKRHFGITPEPQAATGKHLRQQPIFVVQLHHASHRHYDFRLQVGDALRSWAVPKGPSLDPSVKRLAAEVEDHPLDYAGFEGEIPAGQYGAGHVAIFDHGTWHTDGDPQAQLDKGHLRFELDGTRLKGGWHLVRSGKAGRKPQWLLFKANDTHAAARDADDLLAERPADPKPTAAARRGRQTSVRLRHAALTLAGAKAGAPAPRFQAPQLARLVDAVPAGERWLHEAKWDGYRLLAQCVAGKVRLWSRNAREWTHKLPDIVTALQALGMDLLVDGELVAGLGRQQDFGLLQAVLSGERRAPLSYVAFDLLQLADVDLRGCRQDARKQLLQRLLAGVPTPLVYSSHVAGAGERALQVAAQRGLEGIISKRADAPYRSGRGDDWRKIKQRQSEEFVVVGYTAPKGSRAAMGALLLASPDGAGGWRYAGRVGSGFSQDQLMDLKQRFAPLKRKTAALEVPDTLPASVQWLQPSVVVEVFHHGVGNQGLVRQASFKTLRLDKGLGQLQPLASTAHGKEAKMRGSEDEVDTDTDTDADGKVVLSSPDRIVYPGERLRKADVFAYYQAMAPWLLPELSGRPLSVVRCPQGVERACFFQKHMAAGMQHVQALPLQEEDGVHADYLVVNDVAGLLELVQFNALEFHPWGALADQPDKADRLVFDLDPGPQVAWAQMLAAARCVRDRLQAMGLKSFVRTSGGKGLHVVVPLRPACPWPGVKSFARAFAEAMVASDPLAYVATASKKARKGRIFIDYLRNGRGATSVASFSLRAREGAPVAMPLRWEELGRVKHANAYTLVSAPRRMARLKSHPWGDYMRLRQDLSKVVKALDAAANTKPTRR